jgi:hypothetical protein
MEPVKERGVLEKHERAFAGNYIDTAGFAKSHGFAADRTGSRGAIHPHTLDAGLYTIVRDVFGYGWRSHQQHGVSRRNDVLEAREAGPPLDLTPARMDRHGIVAAPQEFTEQQPAEIVGVAGDTRDSEALGGKKSLDLILGCHNSIIGPYGLMLRRFSRRWASKDPGRMNQVCCC